MRHRSLIVAVLVAVLAISLGGLVRQLGWEGSSDPAGAAAGETRAPRIDYVALGDSFSAGPLIPDVRSDPTGCLRSTNSYPAYLAGYLGVRSYRDVTCSGATTDDLFSRQRLVLGDYRPPPQLSALAEDTDLVTIGIGGNDFGLFGSLIATCGQVAASDPGGAPCRAEFTDANGVDTKARDARRIEGRVARVVAAVRTRAPGAEVYLVGYPRLLPDDGTTCARAPLATGDYAWTNRIGRLLNRSVRLAAERGGAHFVGLAAASAGHDVCAGPAAWVNGDTLRLGVAADYHPFRRGMRAEARWVYQAITGRVAPTYAVARPPSGSVVTNPAR